jgi:GT2 family glycosyltransferase
MARATDRPPELTAAAVESIPEQSPGVTRAVDLAIIIVHYETPDLLRDCLASLRATPPAVSHTIVVVDNSRDERSGKEIVAAFPGVRYERSGRNLGFAGGVNRGMAVVPGRYALVLNPDIVAHPGAVDALVGFMEDNPDVGIAGARLLNPDGSLQYSCRTFYTLKTILLRRTPLGALFPRSRTVRDHLYADWDHQAVRDVDWVLGACMLVRREAVEEVGPADERFFLYFEDVDWCYRMHQHGWRVTYVPTATLTHHHRRESARGIRAHGLRVHLVSTLKFYEKWSLLLYLIKKNGDSFRRVGLLVADACGVVLAFLVAYEIRRIAALYLTKPLYPLASYSMFLAIVAAVTLLVFAGSGIYARTWTRARDLAAAMLRASVTSGVLLMAATFVLSVKFSRFILALFVPLLALAATGLRVAFERVAHRAATSGMDVRRVLVIGTLHAAEDLMRSVRARRRRGYAVAGYFDTRAPRYAADTPQALLRRVLRVVRAGRVGDVVLVEPFPDPPVTDLIVEGLRRIGVAVHLAPRWWALLDGASRIEEVAGLPLVAVRRRRSWRGRSRVTPDTAHETSEEAEMRSER